MIIISEDNKQVLINRLKMIDTVNTRILVNKLENDDFDGIESELRKWNDSANKARRANKRTEEFANLPYTDAIAELAFKGARELSEVENELMNIINDLIDKVDELELESEKSKRDVYHG